MRRRIAVRTVSAQNRNEAAGIIQVKKLHAYVLSHSLVYVVHFDHVPYDCDKGFFVIVQGDASIERERSCDSKRLHHGERGLCQQFGFDRGRNE